MAQQDTTQTVRQIFEAWNRHDVDGYVKLLDPATAWESDAFPKAFRGHEGAREFMTGYIRAFPDLNLELEQSLGTGEYVMTRWRMTATHRGEFLGVQPTNRRVQLRGCTITEVKNGKALHAWVYFDNAHLLRQIGALPALKAA